MKSMLKIYFSMQREILQYFGYTETWQEIPLDDQTDSWWFIDAGLSVIFSNSAKEDLLLSIKEDTGNYYQNEIIEGCIFQKKEYTMIFTDSGTDNNRVLQIFDNEKEIKERDLTK